MTSKPRHLIRWPRTAFASPLAFTPSPITNTSHTTILLGLLPSHHGVTDFAIPLTESDVTWAELLQKKGLPHRTYRQKLREGDSSQVIVPGCRFNYRDQRPTTTD